MTDAFGNPVTGAAVTFAGPASGASETFAACTSNPHTYSCVATTNASGVATSSAFTANTTAGGDTVTASATGTNTVNFSETNAPGTATKVLITPTPGTAKTSATTNIALGLQLEDQYGNATTSTGTTTLTLSSSSTKGFFATTTGSGGTLGASATVTFANGVGTATEYYGDETAATPTITAKNGAATWGTTTVTITKVTVAESISGNSGGPGAAERIGQPRQPPNGRVDVDRARLRGRQRHDPWCADDRWKRDNRVCHLDHQRGPGDRLRRVGVLGERERHEHDRHRDIRYEREAYRGGRPRTGRQQHGYADRTKQPPHRVEHNTHRGPARLRRLWATWRSDSSGPVATTAGRVPRQPVGPIWRMRTAMAPEATASPRTSPNSNGSTSQAFSVTTSVAWATIALDLQ